MGADVEQEQFTEDEFARFEQRLERCLCALERLLGRPSFGVGAASIGAEVELDLVDAQGLPRPVGQDVLRSAGDARLALEVNRYNLEVNSKAVPFSGACFTALASDLSSALTHVREVAAESGAQPITIGTLPTLSEAWLGREMMTDRPRYRALSAGSRRLRRQPLELSIQGQDVLRLTVPDVTFEGANTSFQLHLRVSPADFAATYNAAQLATAPVLALAANSPIFLGRRLWDETRVALFRQSVDDRPDVRADDWRAARVSFGHGWVREGIHELFAEAVALHEPLIPLLDSEDPLTSVANGGTPRLSELRLHGGTVWHGNRPVYDPGLGGHLRIELRALPSGPTVADMIGNAAFLLGAVLALRDGLQARLCGMPFGQARYNFYQAARLGLDAELLWWQGGTGRVKATRARELIASLLPQAEAALSAVGVEDAEPFLRIVAARLESGQTGARWQRQVFEQELSRGDAERAAQELVQRYLERSRSQEPVHTWSLD